MVLAVSSRLVSLILLRPASNIVVWVTKYIIAAPKKITAIFDHLPPSESATHATIVTVDNTIPNVEVERNIKSAVEKSEWN